MAGQLSGSVMPTLARPSVRSRQRLTPSLGRGGSATCSQPRSQPSPRFVLPRASIVAQPVDGAARAPRRGGRGLDDDVDDVVVDHDAEPVVGLEPADGLLDRAAWRSRASRPDIEPERSRTNARLTGGRRRSAVARGAVDRRERRSACCGRRADEAAVLADVQGVGGDGSVMIGPPRGALGRSSRGGRPACSGPGERAADVEFDVGGEDDPLPLGAVAGGRRRTDDLGRRRSAGPSTADGAASAAGRAVGRAERLRASGGRRERRSGAARPAGAAAAGDAARARGPGAGSPARSPSVGAGSASSARARTSASSRPSSRLPDLGQRQVLGLQPPDQPQPGEVPRRRTCCPARTGRRPAAGPGRGSSGPSAG